MKRLTILGVVAFVGLIVVPAAVEAGQKVEWNVNVNNSPMDPVNVCDVCEDPCIRDPLLIQENINWSESGSTSTTFVQEAPSGKYIVIETISVNLSISLDDSVKECYLYTTDNGIHKPLFTFPLHRFNQIRETGRVLFGITLAARAVIRSGLGITLYISGIEANPDNRMWVTISGYQVDVQCPRP